MANYNKVIMIGNLTRDPEYKQLSSGNPVTRLSIASNRQYKHKQTGTLVQEVCFIDVDVFGPQAESCRQYLQKGRPVLIEGRLKYDTWQTPEGQTRTKHSIVADRVVFLGSGTGQGLPMEGGFETTSFETGSADIGVAANEFSDQAVLAAQEKLKVQTSKKKNSLSSSGARLASAPHEEEATGILNGAIPAMNAGEFDFKDEAPFKDDLPF